MIRTKKNILEKLFFIYIAFYLLYTLLNKIIPFSLTVDSRVIAVIYSALAAAGVLFLILDAFGKKYIFQIPFCDILILFIIVCVISTLVNHEYNFTDNLKTIVWSAVQILLLGSFILRTPQDQLKRRIQIISNLMILLWAAAIIVSLYQFIFQIHWTVWMPDNPRITRQGFMEGRLFGVFGDPNYAGGISFIMCIFSVLNIRWIKNRAVRLLYILNIFLQMCYIALSGSRTALLTGSVSIFAGVFIYLYLYLPKKAERFSNQLKKVLFSLAVSICGILVFFGTIRVLQRELIKIPEGVTDVEEVSLEREDVEENKDISNNRFHIWADGITLFGSAPILGTSPRGHLSYAGDHFPNMYIVEKQYSLHNSYITVLACTGLAGAACVVIYIILAARRFITYFFNFKGERSRCGMILPLFLIALSIAVISCLSSLIFFGNSVFEVMFWLCVSGALSLIGRDMGCDSPGKKSFSYQLADRITGAFRKKK